MPKQAPTRCLYDTIHEKLRLIRDNHWPMALGELELNPTVFTLIYLALAEYLAKRQIIAGVSPVMFAARDAKGHFVQTELMAKAQMVFLQAIKNQRLFTKISDLLSLQGLNLVTIPLNSEFVNGFFITDLNPGVTLERLAMQVEISTGERVLLAHPVETIDNLQCLGSTLTVGYYRQQATIWNSLSTALSVID